MAQRRRETAVKKHKKERTIWANEEQTGFCYALLCKTRVIGGHGAWCVMCGARLSVAFFF